MRFFTYFTFFLIFFSSQAFSQIDPIFSTYSFNKLYHNPAFAGSDDVRSITSVSRAQWQLIDPPLTFLVSYDQHVKKIKSGIGILLMHDRLGPMTISYAGLNYNYQFKTGESSSLRVGTQISLLHHSVEFDEYITIDPEPNMPSGKHSGLKPDVDFGIIYSLKKSYFGISVKHLFEPVFKFGSFPYPFRRHYYLTAGRVLALGASWTADASLIYRSFPPNKTHVLDLTSIAKHSSGVLVGAAFRVGIYDRYNTNPVIIFTGYNYKNKLQVLLAHDLPNSALGYAIEGNVKVWF